jgi:hypothetical protein
VSFDGIDSLCELCSHHEALRIAFRFSILRRVSYCPLTVTNAITLTRLNKLSRCTIVRLSATHELRLPHSLTTYKMQVVPTESTPSPFQHDFQYIYLIFLFLFIFSFFSTFSMSYTIRISESTSTQRKGGIMHAI